METIKNYLDNMFSQLPKGEAMQRLKADLLATMEDKYEELKAEGKSENEAIGVVISEFGNIDELLEAMQVKAPESEPAPGYAAPVYTAAAPAPRPVHRVDTAEVSGYVEIKRRTGLLVGLGVLTILLSPAIFVLIEEYARRGTFGGILAIAVFMTMIATAVGLFIYSDHLMGPFKYIEKESFKLSDDARAMVQAQNAAFRGVQTRSTIAGVALILLSPVVFLITGAVLPSAFAIATMLTMVAVAVFTFCYAGNQSDSFSRLLQQGDHKPKTDKGKRCIEAIGAVYWPVCVLLYLGWSFFFVGWGYSWIIWPVAGVLFWAISAAVEVITRNPEDCY